MCTVSLEIEWQGPDLYIWYFVYTFNVYKLNAESCLVPYCQWIWYLFWLIDSGGTIAGLSLGSWLGTLKAKVCFHFYKAVGYIHLEQFGMAFRLFATLLFCLSHIHCSLSTGVKQKKIIIITIIKISHKSYMSSMKWFFGVLYLDPNERQGFVRPIKFMLGANIKRQGQFSNFRGRGSLIILFIR